MVATVNRPKSPLLFALPMQMNAFSQLKLVRSNAHISEVEVKMIFIHL
jgi:hypothetical protein